MIVVYKKFFLMLGVTVLLCLSASVVWSETIDDIRWRDGIAYKKFTDIPFSGKVNGQEKGSLKNGKKEGKWFTYYNNKKLLSLIEYENGIQEGIEEWYWENGNLKSKEETKNKLREGNKFTYYENGNLKSKMVFMKPITIMDNYYLN